ncbi:MAG TPA: hypothetical protein VH682_10500 [Gemmataceae bacterium]|jgi:hypothetical protein
MKRLILALGTAVVILPWLAAAKAQADAIHWTASGSPLGPTQIFPQNGVDAAISLFPGNTTTGTNTGSVVALEVFYSINPDALNTPTFGGPSANYSLSLALHDDASGASGSLTFRGNFSGSGGTVSEASLTNTFLGPTTQTLMLGGNLYTVTIGPYVNPSLSQEGSLSASISTQPATNSTPEPSSLVLACLGLPSLGLARWFRRRNGVNSSAGQA